MLGLYSYINEKLRIHHPYEDLWSIMKSKGKHILLPISSTNEIIHEPIIIFGKLLKNKKFHFCNDSNDFIINNYGNELQLSIDYDYEIEWEIKSNHDHNFNIGFYSPDRKFKQDRLFLNFDKKEIFMNYEKMWRELKAKIENTEEYYECNFPDGEYKKNKVDIIELINQFIFDCEFEEEYKNDIGGEQI